MRQSQRYYAFYKMEEQKEQAHPALLGLYEWVATITISLVIVFALLGFAFRIISVTGTSMQPTLNNKDRLVVSNISTQYQYGDIIVILYHNHDEEKDLIKRVIATGGDKVAIDYANGIVYVNDVPLDEPYIRELTHRRPLDDVKFPVTVPQGYVFVMGDNRNKSVDSRALSVGFLDERYIFGKAYFRLVPFGDWGIY